MIQYFYNTKVRLHIKAAGLIPDTLEYRDAGDETAKLTKTMGLTPEETAAVMLLGYILNEAGDDEEVRRGGLAWLHEWGKPRGCDMQKVVDAAKVVVDAADVASGEKEEADA